MIEPEKQTQSYKNVDASDTKINACIFKALDSLISFKNETHNKVVETEKSYLNGFKK